MGEELRYATMLVHCGELQIKYVDIDTTFTGSLIEKNNQYLIDELIQLYEYSLSGKLNDKLSAAISDNDNRTTNSLDSNTYDGYMASQANRRNVFALKLIIPLGLSLFSHAIHLQ